MYLRNPRSPQILRLLRASACTPVVFRRFLFGLDPAHLDVTWKLAFDLAKIEHPGVQESAHHLTLWCTQRTLERIWKR